MSASWCFTAWKLPMMRPNCTRSLAQATRLVEHALRRAQRVGGEHDAAGIEHAQRGGARIVGGVERLHRRAVEADHRDGRVRSRVRLRLDRHALVADRRR